MDFEVWVFEVFFELMVKVDWCMFKFGNFDFCVMFMLFGNGEVCDYEIGLFCEVLVDCYCVFGIGF